MVVANPSAYSPDFAIPGMREYLREHGAYYRLTSDDVDNDAADAHANENGFGIREGWIGRS